MKLTIVSSSGLTNHIIPEFKALGVWTDSPKEADVVINKDPAVGVWTWGKKLTVFWEIDEFLNIGKKHYDHIDMSKVGLHYITHKTYQKHRPNSQVLPMAVRLEDIQSAGHIFDYVHVGRIEDSPVYRNRLNKLIELHQQGQHFAILSTNSYEDYMTKLSNGMFIVDILPFNPDNGLSCLHVRVFEAMATGCLMVEEDPILDELFVKGKHYLPLSEFGKATVKQYEDVSLASFNEIKEKHTWKHRAEQMLKDIQERL